MTWLRKLTNRGGLLLALAALAPTSALGESFVDGMHAYDQGDYAEALTIWKPLAEEGDQVAQSLLAMMYENGEGVRPQPTLAASWYERAARAGHPQAQFHLGRFYRDGVGVDRDSSEAFVWLSLAAESIPKDASGENSATRALTILVDDLDTPALNAAQDRLEQTSLEIKNP